MQKTYLPDLSFQSRNWRFRTVRPPFLLLFVPCAEVRKPVSVAFLCPGCFLFRFLPTRRAMLFAVPSVCPFQPSQPPVVFGRIWLEVRKQLCVKSLEVKRFFTEASVNFLQSLRSNATAALEYCSDGLGALLQQLRRNLTGRLRNARRAVRYGLKCRMRPFWISFRCEILVYMAAKEALMPNIRVSGRVL